MIWSDLKVSMSDRLVRVQMLFEYIVAWHDKNLKNILSLHLILNINKMGISTDRNPPLAVSDFAC